jgi:chromosome partitioning protein
VANLYIISKPYQKEIIMIILAGGIKGGSGKSTIATNLAVIRALAGRDVLLIDADDQETAYDFTLRRNEQTEGNAGYTCIKLTGAAVRTEGVRLAKKYEDIIIDSGGRDTTSQRAGIAIADVMLVPFLPRSFDLWTIEKVAGLVEEMRQANDNLRAYTFLNRTDARGADNEETEKELKSYSAVSFINTPIGARKAFSNAAAGGKAVTELKPQDDKASAEILSLYQVVFETGNIS